MIFTRTRTPPTHARTLAGVALRAGWNQHTNGTAGAPSPRPGEETKCVPAKKRSVWRLRNGCVHGLPLRACCWRWLLRAWQVIQALAPLPAAAAVSAAAHDLAVPHPPWARGSRRYTIGADVVELNERRGVEEGAEGEGEPGRGAMVAAKLVKELASFGGRFD
jgi:hypothetical protein